MGECEAFGRQRHIFSVPVSPKDPATRAAYQVMFLHLLGHAFGLKDEEEHPIAKADSAALVPDGPQLRARQEDGGILVGEFRCG